MYRLLAGAASPLYGNDGSGISCFRGRTEEDSVRRTGRTDKGCHGAYQACQKLAEVREVCDYIMIISSGKLVASDDPEKLEKKIGGEGFVEIQARATAEEVKGVPLLEITRTKTTLEEVFLELTQGKAVESEEQMYDSDI